MNDGNVSALIRRAKQDGHAVLATELREWQLPAGISTTAVRAEMAAR